ncbi:hypothetical protein KPH14_002673 [Odynerus spinipes]|uniref:Transposable element P transposase-like RNase H C-terminal domain-containing protein n=1 Tax=Odynerus spinipes TaxID=1348599 RepID=A0AAD9RE40_9HYME|nr:hypothetical protein KPH14_002673 [Odynerus spinipes]
MPKLTDEHVVPDKIKKMKVSKCTQVFSNTVASIISLMSRTEAKSKCGSSQMPIEGEATAHLLLFLNDLFDTVNGGNSKISSKNNIRKKISVTGPCEQEEIWNKAISIFQNMKFIPRKMRDRKRPPVLKNWVHTLRGFKLLRESLYNLGFTDFAARSFNQDCIENFFDQIRQHGVRNVNPTCTAFMGYYKSLIFNAFVASSTNGGNCEDEGKFSNLVQLESFLNYPARLNLNDAPSMLPDFPLNFPIYDSLTEAAYICIDMFLKRSGVIQYTKTCHVCLQNIMQIDDLVVMEDEQIFSAVSTYNRFFIKTLTKVTHVCNFYLPRICHFLQLSRKLKHYVLQSTSFYFVKCEHAEELERFVINSYVDFFIRQYLMNVRKILSGSHHSVVDFNVFLEAAL